MKITTIIITILSIFVINTCKACMCSSLKTITFQYQQADFVATVKIIKNYKNFPNNNEYYKADVEIINLYKGKKVKSIYVLGSNGGIGYNSCGTFISEGETRLIFGSINKDLTISTYICTSYHKPSEPYYKRDNIDEKLILLKHNAKNTTINFRTEMAIYPYDFKFIYNPDSTSYYSLIKVVVKKDGFVKDIKSITGDSKALKKIYNDYFVNIFNWKSRLPKINPNNKTEDITLFFEVMPYTSIKKKP